MRVAPTAAEVAADANDQPLFRRLGDALTFAYTIDLYPAAPKSELAKLLRGSVRVVSDMGSLDWHAQAALIRVHVRTHLPEVERLVIEGYYRRGWGSTKAVGDLARIVTPELSEDVEQPQAFVRVLVWRFLTFGSARCPSVHRIAAQFDRNPKTVAKWYGRVRATLGAHASKAEGRLFDDFVRGGLIEDPNRPD